MTNNFVHWTRLIDGIADVTGLFLPKHSAVGVTWKSSTDEDHSIQPAATLRAEAIPQIALGMQVIGVFLTTATLLEISQLQICREGSRCLGLLVHHIDGSTEALGC